MIQVGATVPSFSLSIAGGGNLSLDDLENQRFVLYFYPKADTPGCTKEACAFREAQPLFHQVRTKIIGISKDPVKKHEKFGTKYDLKFTLASDETSTTCEDFGVWKEKNMYGRRYMGIERSTFLIDENGILRNEWRKVKVAGHVEDVLTAAGKL